MGIAVLSNGRLRPTFNHPFPCLVSKENQAGTLPSGIKEYQPFTFSPSSYLTQRCDAYQQGTSLHISFSSSCVPFSTQFLIVTCKNKVRNTQIIAFFSICIWKAFSLNYPSRIYNLTYCAKRSPIQFLRLHVWPTIPCLLGYEDGKICLLPQGNIS